MDDCIFCKIVRGEIPAQKLYEDAEFVAFHDIRPAAPVHFLIIPKVHIPTLGEVSHEYVGLLGRMLLLAPTLAAQQGLAGGFKVHINTGKDGGQEVFHLHLHVLGGKRV